MMAVIITYTNKEGPTQGGIVSSYLGELPLKIDGKVVPRGKDMAYVLALNEGEDIPDHHDIMNENINIIDMDLVPTDVYDNFWSNGVFAQKNDVIVDCDKNVIIAGGEDIATITCSENCIAKIFTPTSEAMGFSIGPSDPLIFSAETGGKYLISIESAATKRKEVRIDAVSL